MVTNVSDGAARRRGDRGGGRRGAPEGGLPALLDPPGRNLLDALPPAARTGCRTGLLAI
jgi:hypothetical protein